MSDYRKFWLVNSQGEKYYLTDDTKCKTFLNTPSGFGFKSRYKTRKINNSELLISEGLDMVDITGELVFYNSSPNLIYEDYQNFISFIRFKPIEFHYLTPNFVDDERYSFYSNVIISNINKGEMSQDGTLRTQITIHRLSQWLDSSEHVFLLSNSTDGAVAPEYSSSSAYDVGDRVRHTDWYVYNTDAPNSIVINDPSIHTYSSYNENNTYAVDDYVKNGESVYKCNTAISQKEKWNSDHWTKIMDEIEVTYECITKIETSEAFDSTKWKRIQVGKNYPLMRPYYYIGNDFSSGLEITNSGTDEVGITVTINGTISNPIFTLYQNNTRYGLCALKGTYDHIIVNSVDGDSFIYLEEANGLVVSNPEQKQDFSVRDEIAYFTWCKLKVGVSTFILTAGNLDAFSGTVEVAFKNSYFSV